MGKKRVKREHPLYNNEPCDFYVDPKKGDDVEGDGSKEKPVRTIRGLNRLIERLIVQKNDEIERKQKAERETAEWEKRERERKEADRAREEEIRAKEQELDGKIGLLQTELTALEKLFLETTCTFECMKVDLLVDSKVGTFLTDGETVKNCAREIHKLQTLLLAKKVEHDLLVDERAKLGFSKWNHWIILGGMAALAMGAIYWSLFAKKKKT